MSRPEAGDSLYYTLHYPGNGVYVFMIEGKAKIAGKHLLRRDALGISEAEEIHIEPNKDAFILFLEVPMK